MLKVGFDARVLNERGTSVALQAYAEGVEDELGAQAVVFHEAGGAGFNPGAVKLASRRLELVGYSDLDDLGRKARETGVDLLYAFNFGLKDTRLVRGPKNVRHVMLQHYRPYGDVYAYISEWMAAQVSMGRQPWAPLIVKLPPAERRLRKAWGFSDEAVVLGRHGGFDEFDLPFVHGAIEAALAARPDLCFVFLNTRPFLRHERVRFLETVYDDRDKSDFIASCDGMIHGRKAGEGFGLAPAEFLLFDKPVICWAGGKDRNHLELIPDRRHVYRSARDLFQILLRFQPAAGDGHYSAAVAAYAPGPVMRKFADVFVDERETPGPPPPWTWRAASKLRARARVLQGRYWRDRGAWEAAAMNPVSLAGR